VPIPAESVWVLRDKRRYGQIELLSYRGKLFIFSNFSGEGNRMV
jgi:hypothetical protein